MRRSAYPQLQALCLLIAVLFFSSSAFSHTASSSNGNTPERSIYIESQTAVLEGLARVVDDGVSITDVTYAHLNHLGSPVAFTDDSGNVVWPGQSGGTPYEVHSYEPFGADFADLGSPIIEQDVRFTGKLFDANTEKHYFNARYYNGITTDSAYEMPPRFLCPDNMKGSPDCPQRWNRYQFCQNNPIIFIDPDGLFEVYVHTQEWGHVGIKTNYNGHFISYDFGRYHRIYTDSFYSGPNILKRTPGISDASTKIGYKEYSFKTSQQLDNIIASTFRGKFDEGQSNLPENVKNRLHQDKMLKPEKERYMGSDWGLNGPNCVSFTEETLLEALDKVLEGTSYSAEIKSEARSTKKSVKGIFSMTFSPAGVKENLEEFITSAKE